MEGALLCFRGGGVELEAGEVQEVVALSAIADRGDVAHSTRGGAGRDWSRGSRGRVERGEGVALVDPTVDLFAGGAAELSVVACLEAD